MRADLDRYCKTLARRWENPKTHDDAKASRAAVLERLDRKMVRCDMAKRRAANLYLTGRIGAETARARQDRLRGIYATLLDTRTDIFACCGGQS